ncbi:MAG: efflux RND transporter periplasmic adaptor subunit [Flavobacteriaceae bacterium CG_4_8_14_3_um_filter_34_10]|nr:efflux RND transporter periplasmic adaptor subunit [Flavobacteriia bacterium]OIP49862.1 MAG: efflux transporter periplasmic adaptor subunit [Flavobacteriaceae bacterium CG2_30_34_30]PIV50978.1 MAG: efflux RND transporter periplasmic adaptor subunit [Flavobacteriaceae bacterium CG02_land_8_20_14_3_00_34_13]PIX10513.1 MAG: efflux RND transporter periplasmic adaptor subunit [Flavobacteriaceae bacterium CG_4_8_14_3_um_filter_34_10]PJC08138.1 MAG: efflux RND transporter periplasmic adaptor subuni
MKHYKFKIQNLSKITIVLIFSTFITISCTTKKESNEPILIEDNEISGIVTLTHSQFLSSEMKLGSLSKQVFHNSVKANGIIDVPPENKASVSAYFEGYVKEINLLPGQEIIKGQVLFTLENPNYIQIQEDFLVAKARLGYLKSDYERQKELVKDNVTSQKNYLKAESEYRATLAIYESLKKKLNLMNISPDNITENFIRSTINVVAPISGNITSVQAEKGMYLNPSDIAVTITNTDHLHLELSIFETDFNQVEIGQEIQFSLQNQTNQFYNAKVYLISKSIDAKKRTANVHGHLYENAETNVFAPGMYVEAEIYTKTDSLYALPNEAIVTLENKHYVLLKTNQDAKGVYFEKQEIQIGKSSKGYTEIKKSESIQENSELLIKGAFNLIAK